LLGKTPSFSTFVFEGNRGGKEVSGPKDKGQFGIRGGGGIAFWEQLVRIGGGRLCTRGKGGRVVKEPRKSGADLLTEKISSPGGT